MYDNIVDNRLQHAINQVAREDGQAINVASKAKTLKKFGRSSLVDSNKFHDLWPLSDAGEPYRPATNLLTEIMSDDANDTEPVLIEGFTIAAGVLTFISQTVTLNGTTEVLLTSATQSDGSAGVALGRCTRIKNQTTSGTDLVGNIYVWDGSADTTPGTPDDLTKVGGHISITDQQTQQSFTSVSSTDYFFITQMFASVNRVQAAAVDVQIDTRDVGNGGTWLPAHPQIGLHTTGATSVELPLDPVIIVRPNHDIRVRAQGSSATNTQVSCFFAGYLAEFV